MATDRIIDVKSGKGSVVRITLPSQQLEDGRVNPVLIVDTSRLEYLVRRAVERKGLTSVCNKAFTIMVSGK